MENRSLLLVLVAAMAFVVALSNYLVQFPFGYLGLGSLLTWGAFTYPLAFLVNDLTNRRFGAASARRIVYAGFVLAVVLSIFLATPRIAIASGTAFLAAQLLDTSIFDRLRRQAWWRAPLVSTLAGSAFDTVLFFSLAFAGSFSFLDRMTGQADGSLVFPASFAGVEVPLWISLAAGDFAVKCLVGFAMLAPYGMALRVMAPRAGAA